MIYIVVALSAEARPLVQHLDLVRAEHLAPLSVFCRSDLSLIVSGVGKELATTAIDNLARAIPAEGPSIWLNVGVAGHRRHDIGTAVLASQVVDAETGRIHRLRVPTNLHLEKGEVCTVSHVETRFESDALYDMEAAAFCERAGRLTSSELIQVLKIVSDNRRTGTVAVSAHQVQALMEKSLPKLDLVISNLHRQARRFFD